jgi:leucyl-tRNA synthetase
VKRVTTDLERMQFNTAIAALMEFVNALSSGTPGAPGATWDDLVALVKLVGPFAPHLGDEAWERLRLRQFGDAGATTGVVSGNRGLENGFLIEAAWPTYDDALTLDATVTIGVQVDGKVRGTVEIARDAPEADARAAALGVANVTKHLEGRHIAKFIYKPGRIVGIVTKQA